MPFLPVTGMFICISYQLTFQLAKLEDGCGWMVAVWFGTKRGMFLYCADVYSLFQKLSEIFFGFNATLLFSRLMMWKLFQTTPTEMMLCSFLKPFTPMYVKYWKPFMVSAENLLMNCQYCDSYGVFTSRLLCFPQDSVVWIYVLARDTVLCSRARHFTLIVPLSTQVQGSKLTF